MTNAPLLLTVAPVTLSPADFSTGNGSPVIIELIDGAVTFNHDAVYRHFLARAHP